MNRIIFTLGGKCQHEVRVRKISTWKIPDAIAAGYCFSSSFLAGPLLDITFFVVVFVESVIYYWNTNKQADLSLGPDKKKSKKVAEFPEWY